MCSLTLSECTACAKNPTPRYTTAMMRCSWGWAACGSASASWRCSTRISVATSRRARASNPSSKTWLIFSGSTLTGSMPHLPDYSRSKTGSPASIDWSASTDRRSMRWSKRRGRWPENGICWCRQPNTWRDSNRPSPRRGRSITRTLRNSRPRGALRRVVSAVSLSASLANSLWLRRDSRCDSMSRRSQRSSGRRRA